VYQGEVWWVGSRALLICALLASPANATASEPPPVVATVPLGEARAVVSALRDTLPAPLRGMDDGRLEAAWPGWVRERDRSVRERLVRGEADAVVNLLFFGTSFTGAPRLTAAAMLSGDSKAIVASLERRLADLLDALGGNRGGERIALTRALLEAQGVRLGAPKGRERAAVWLLENVARVRREQAALAAELERAGRLPDATARLAARSTLFRERGIALDTSLRPAFAIEEALADALARGLLTKDSVRRVAVVGPGLDFVDKAEGQDFYPPQSLQSLALVDSLVRLGLADPASLRVTAFDISPLVLDHLSRARDRAAAGEGYALQLPRPRDGWGGPLVAYWQRFGEAVADDATAAKPPPTAGRVEVRAVRVRPAFVRLVRPVDLNVVYQRLELPEGERFDLVVATNILVYYDTFEQCLAMANVASMTAPGGLFLTNNLLLELPDSALRSAGYKTIVFSDAPEDGEHVLFYRKMQDAR
jgi:hypothetical protein